MKISNFNSVLSHADMKAIRGGESPSDGDGSSCSASPTNCPTHTCGCDVQGPVSCTGGTNSATCNCNGYTITISC